jgi:hypothetical protein
MYGWKNSPDAAAPAYVRAVEVVCDPVSSCAASADDAAAAAAPSSRSFACPSLVMKTFEGFTLP